VGEAIAAGQTHGRGRPLDRLLQLDAERGSGSGRVPPFGSGAGIQELAPHIAFVHARNVRGTARHFTETWHDNGEIDMPAVFRALKEGGYTGSVRPDHAPSMAGETNATPGYEMLCRLFAAGYHRGLTQAV
jgi:hypothetical protein